MVITIKYINGNIAKFNLDFMVEIHFKKGTEEEEEMIKIFDITFNMSEDCNYFELKESTVENYDELKDILMGL